MTAFVTNPARDDPDDFVFKPSGQQSILAFKAGGEIADAIVFGFVMRSTVVEGRTHTAGNNGTRLLKDIEIIPIAQEGERLLAMLSMVMGGKIVSLAITDEGGISFATKHTAVDEDGNPEAKSTSLHGFSLSPFLNIVQRASLAASSYKLLAVLNSLAEECIPIFSVEHTKEQIQVRAAT